MAATIGILPLYQVGHVDRLLFTVRGTASCRFFSPWYDANLPAYLYKLDGRHLFASPAAARHLAQRDARAVRMLPCNNALYMARTPLCSRQLLRYQNACALGAGSEKPSPGLLIHYPSARYRLMLRIPFGIIASRAYARHACTTRGAISVLPAHCAPHARRALAPPLTSDSTALYLCSGSDPPYLRKLFCSCASRPIGKSNAPTFASPFSWVADPGLLPYGSRRDSVWRPLIGVVAGVSTASSASWRRCVTVRHL